MSPSFSLLTFPSNNSINNRFWWSGPPADQLIHFTAWETEKKETRSLTPLTCLLVLRLPFLYDIPRFVLLPCLQILQQLHCHFSIRVKSLLPFHLISPHISHSDSSESHHHVHFFSNKEQKSNAFANFRILLIKWFFLVVWWSLTCTFKEQPIISWHKRVTCLKC